jgi:glycosyltransferase involved in cell wall biosynthesis
MSTPKHNAAIWYASDGYDPDNKGINGRRVAGASFLKGFAAHGRVEEFVSLSENHRGAKAFEAQMRALGVSQPIRGVSFFNARKIAPVDVVYYPAPNYASELWRRQSLGSKAYSICGITHTTATTAVMQGAVDLRLAPQMPWDAVICTSKAVLASQEAQQDMADDYLRARFGNTPPRPVMPVIPLGITPKDYAHDPEARARLRKQMNLGEKDIVISTLSRLTPFGKFDPFPLFMAMEDASQKLPKGLKLHFVACGIYTDEHSRKIFEDGAAKLMPNVSFTHLDGASAEARIEALSGADIFTFPIDNIQETFGLAPLEAMAAGLPQITTDWDGMRDTVSEDVGIRVPTRSLPAGHGAIDAWGYLTKRLSYAQYSNNISAMTEVDLPALTEAIVTLASDPIKRKAMGAAGLKRVNEQFSWKVIIPQYQDLWGELSSIRGHAETGVTTPHLHPNPIAPSPMKLFQSYPSALLPKGIAACVATGRGPELEEMFSLRQYDRLKQPFEKPDTLRRVLDCITESGTRGAVATDVAKTLSFNPMTVERCYAWLLKYGYIARVG